MTDARDELANLIRDTVHSGARRVNWEDIADVILAAGWRPCNGRHWREARDCNCGDVEIPENETQLVADGQCHRLHGDCYYVPPAGDALDR